MILSFPIYGEKIGETCVDLNSAPPEIARAVIHRSIITDSRRRVAVPPRLTMVEVRGSGRKPYQQKKTGWARRGSNRTPPRLEGGVVFGPKPKDWSIKINWMSTLTCFSQVPGNEAGFKLGHVGPSGLSLFPCIALTSMKLTSAASAQYRSMKKKTERKKHRKRNQSTRPSCNTRFPPLNSTWAG